MIRKHLIPPALTTVLALSIVAFIFVLTRLPAYADLAVLAGLIILMLGLPHLAIVRRLAGVDDAD